MKTKIKVSTGSVPRYRAAIRVALIAEAVFVLMVATVAWVRGAVTHG